MLSCVCQVEHNVSLQMSLLSLHGTSVSLRHDISVFLTYIHSKSRVFLLFDGADNLDILQEFLPHSSARTHVLVTTRCSSDHEILKLANNVVQLEMLRPDDAVSALFAWLQGKMEYNSEEVKYAWVLVQSALIRGLPIAIAHAGTFMRMTGTSCRKYFELLSEKESELEARALDFGSLLHYFQGTHLRRPLAAVEVRQPSDLQELNPERIETMPISEEDKWKLRVVQEQMRYSHHVYLTWEFDIDRVKDRSPDAMRILEYASLMNPRNIPDALLRDLAFSESGREHHFSLALVELASFTLISVVETNERNFCFVHELVQRSVFHRLLVERGLLRHRLVQVSHYLLSALPSDERDIRNCLRGNDMIQLTPHVFSVSEKILMNGFDDSVCSRLVRIACVIAIMDEQVDTASNLCSRHLRAVELSYGKDKNSFSAVEKMCDGQLLLSCIYSHLTCSDFVVLRLMGQACELQVRPDEAQSYYAKALVLIEGLDDRTREKLTTQHVISELSA